ncbi:hypothetical protein Xph01_55410 [Micromonospora phaseoli]|nr:hypothetical protein Xph01_55410 [Micromonospora phaseoli]
MPSSASKAPIAEARRSRLRMAERGAALSILTPVQERVRDTSGAAAEDIGVSLARLVVVG